MNCFHNRLTALLATLTVSTTLFASPAAAAAYINPVHITGINARDVGFDIYVDANVNPDGCALSGYIRVASGTQNRGDLIATALTSYGTGKPIKAYLNGCSADGVPLAYTIWTIIN